MQKQCNTTPFQKLAVEGQEVAVKAVFRAYLCGISEPIPGFLRGVIGQQNPCNII